ncbi:vacuolar protein sorting-associated protein [Striga asiatica]|uniref:Vacuolar protein sorting-associated protein n=1 Tax=Striga asiatica TaxID=4170 RepID=A0A5A7RAV1_STRAF|nr:vacuolar protein sorting-associated protein [Striga asiatica]
MVVKTEGCISHTHETGRHDDRGNGVVVLKPRRVMEVVLAEVDLGRRIERMLDSSDKGKVTREVGRSRAFILKYYLWWKNEAYRGRWKLMGPMTKGLRSSDGEIVMVAKSRGSDDLDGLEKLKIHRREQCTRGFGSRRHAPFPNSPSSTDLSAGSPLPLPLPSPWLPLTPAASAYCRLGISIKPVRDTREKQIQLWKELILDYSRSQKVYVVGLDEDFPLFTNPVIERSLSHEAREAFMSALVAEGRAEWYKSHRKCLILWHRIQDWADLIIRFVQDNGLEDSVMTVEEIRSGVESRGTEGYCTGLSIVSDITVNASRYGKKVLLQFLRGALPLYIMSCFLLPKDHRIDQQFTSFWWSKGNTNIKNIHWRSWNLLSLRKDKLKVGDILSINDLDTFKEDKLIWDYDNKGNLSVAFVVSWILLKKALSKKKQKE